MSIEHAKVKKYMYSKGLIAEVHTMVSNDIRNTIVFNFISGFAIVNIKSSYLSCAVLKLVVTMVNTKPSAWYAFSLKIFI